MMRLRVSDFSYDLPPSFIAQEPPPRRDDSRLMVVHLDSGIVEHRYFREIARYLGNGALLVLNDSKVIPARLLGMKAETGGKVEVLLLRDLGRGAWECLLNPSARLRAGTVIALDDSPMMALVTGRHSQETHTVILSGVDDVGAEIDRVGHVPLPPYIKRRNPKPAMRRPSPPQAGESQTCPRQSGFPRLRRIPNPDRDLAQRDRERYQTVYARRPGAVAAPTAGLHFSQQLLRELSRGGTKMVPITLHVGLGTFRPVKELYVEEHRLHAE
jgi:S-adenosylmethionine:tRNA ribosyltransferase-isomerase